MKIDQQNMDYKGKSDADHLAALSHNMLME